MDRRRFIESSVAAWLVPAAVPPGRILLVPAYFYPAGKGLKQWDRLIASARKATIVAIANPASGPGEKPDPLYTAVLTRADKAGIVLIGYVSTRYAKRPAEQIVADMERWHRFYPQVRGFFLDEQASDAASVPFYEGLKVNARRMLPSARIVANPGTACEPAYLARQTADVFSVFEGAAPAFAAWRPPRWTADARGNQLAAIVYDVPRADAMRRVLFDSRMRNAGIVYVTDARGENPYDRLPTYWEDEVRFIARGE